MRQDKDRLIIRQSVQARSREYDENLEARYEMRYFLSPYKRAALRGQGAEHSEHRYVRYFETEGQIEPVTGRVSARIARFDLQQPLVFSIIPPTRPSNYVEAVKDGILYWNLAFGKAIVQAREGAAEVTAPDADFNIIQWVPWDNAGFAYADDLMDPLTGQSEHGQAYITSVFAFRAGPRPARCCAAWRKWPSRKRTTRKKPGGHDRRLPFLGHGPACDIDPVQFAQQMATGLKEVLASDELTDAAVLRISQDYVREVVAHEVGHVWACAIISPAASPPR